tara:strand:- start:1202 stop:1726 length:525 start_codon:yes stop_codon:yes gene_type:complete
MKIKKVIKSKMEREYFFIKGKLDIDCKYFIKKIEEGIQAENNKNYQTNVVGKMTSYIYFLNDKNFIKSLLPVFDTIDSYSFKECNAYILKEAWGFKEGFSEYTKEHRHLPSFLSGVIMLNKHHQSLFFPTINEHVNCEPGNFSLFSSFLPHKNNRNLTDKIRYGLSFNLNYHTS